MYTPEAARVSRVFLEPTSEVRLVVEYEPVWWTVEELAGMSPIQFLATRGNSCGRLRERHIRRVPPKLFPRGSQVREVCSTAVWQGYMMVQVVVNGVVGGRHWMTRRSTDFSQSA